MAVKVFIEDRAPAPRGRGPWPRSLGAGFATARSAQPSIWSSSPLLEPIAFERSPVARPCAGAHVFARAAGWLRGSWPASTWSSTV